MAPPEPLVHPHLRSHQTRASTLEDAAARSCGDSEPSTVWVPHMSRRGTLAAVMALAAVACQPRDAAAAEEAVSIDAAGAAAADGATQTVYFGRVLFI